MGSIVRHDGSRSSNIPFVVQKPEEKKGLFFQLPSVLFIHSMEFLEPRSLVNFSRVSKAAHDFGKKVLNDANYWHPFFRKLNISVCYPCNLPEPCNNNENSSDKGDGKSNSNVTAERLCKACMLPWKTHSDKKMVDAAPSGNLRNLLAYHQSWPDRIRGEGVKKKRFLNIHLPWASEIEQHYGFENGHFFVYSNGVFSTNLFVGYGKNDIQRQGGGFYSMNQKICASSMDESGIYFATSKKVDSKYSVEIHHLKICSSSPYSLVNLILDHEPTALACFLKHIFLICNGELISITNKVVKKECNVKERLEDDIAFLSLYSNQAKEIDESHGVLMVGTRKGASGFIFIKKDGWSFDKEVFRVKEGHLTSIENSKTNDKNIVNFHMIYDRTKLIEVNLGDCTIKLPSDLKHSDPFEKDNLLESNEIPSACLRKIYKAKDFIVILMPSGEVKALRR